MKILNRIILFTIISIFAIGYIGARVAPYLPRMLNSTSFKFDPKLGMSGKTFYSPLRRAETPGNFSLVIKTNTTKDIYLQFAPAPIMPNGTWQSTGCYMINIGGYGNTKTWVQANPYDTRNTDFISMGITPNTDEYFWVTIKDNKEISLGKGQTPGQNTAKTWTIPTENQTSKPVQFVGLGGNDVVVDFKEINIISSSTTDQQTVSNEVKSVCTGGGNTIFYFSGQPDANGQMAWKQMLDGRAINIAIAPSGEMLCVGTDKAIWFSKGLDSSGKANWVRQNNTNNVSKVAIGGNDKFVHIGNNNNVWYFFGSADANGQMAWKQMPDTQARDIAIAPDGKMLHVGMTNNPIYYSSGLDSNGKPNWKKQNGTWATKVAIGGNDKFIHIGGSNLIYYFTGAADSNGQMAWKQIDGKVSEIALASDGKIIAVGTNNINYYSPGLDANNKPNWKKQEGTWASSIAIVSEQAETPQTDVDFTFDPSTMGQGKITFKPEWTFENPQDLSVTFEARGKKEIVVVLSSTQDESGVIYKLAIGRGNNNYTSLVGKADYTTPLGTDVQGVGVTGGMPDNGTKFDNYWISLKGNVFSFGTGTAGSNVKGQWTISQTIPQPKFVGLGGWSEKVEYKNISISSARIGLPPLPPVTPIVTVPFNPPADWTEDTADSIPLTSITVGSRNGEMEAWGVGNDGKPYRYNPYAGFPYTLPTAAATSPWEKQELKDATGVEISGITGISVSSLGFMVAIRKDNKTAIKYDWEKKNWTPLIATPATPVAGASTFQLKQISINEENEIFAIADVSNTSVNPAVIKKDQLCIFDKSISNWAILSPGSYVSIGMDTTKKLLVVAIAQDGTPYECTMTKDSAGNFVKDTKKGTFAPKWAVMPGATNLECVTVGNRDNIFAADKDSKLWKWDDKAKKFNSVLGKDGTQASGIELVSVNAAGTIFAIDAEGDSLCNKTDGVKVTATGVTSVTPTKETKVAAIKGKKLVSKKSPKKAVKKAVKKTAKKAATKKTTTKRTVTKKTTPKKKTVAKKTAAAA